MTKLCAALSAAVLFTMVGCSKSEDVEVTAMKESITKITSDLTAEQTKLVDQRTAIEMRLDTIRVHLKQMKELTDAMDRVAPPPVEPTKATASLPEKDRADYERLKKVVADLEAKQKAAEAAKPAPPSGPAPK